jgi:hypothetical protein
MPKLPEKIEDWLAPWETATGENEIDKAKLKRYLFGLLGDKEKLQERLTESNTERDELKKAADDKAREGETETQRLAREKKELEDRLAEASKGGDSADELLRLRVALKKGLNENDVKRLIGKTEDELLKDADELLKSFGRGGNSEEGEGGDEGGDGVRRVPRGNHNPGDPNPGEGADVKVEKALESIPRVR